MIRHYLGLALLQMFLVILLVLFTGFALKSRLWPLPVPSFPVIVRDYGFLLLLAPVAWYLWACWQSRRPTHDTRGEAIIAISGVCLCLALIAFGCVAISAAWSAPVIQLSPAVPSSP